MLQYSVPELRDILYEIHGDGFEFPYLETEYIGSKSRITSVCLIHGTLIKSLSALLYNKTGCPKCASLRRVISRGTSKENSRKGMLQFYTWIKNKYGPLHGGMIRLNYRDLATLFLKCTVYVGHNDFLK